jgi:formate/nitrite transporter FocA (FNT family)
VSQHGRIEVRHGGDVLRANPLPVTLRNMIGVSLMVGLVSWSVYLRRH